MIGSLEQIAQQPQQRPSGDEIALSPSESVAGLMQELGYSDDEIANPDADERRMEGVTSRLAAHVRRAWDAARMAKEPIQRRMLSALRQRQGIYEPDVLAEIQEQGGSQIFMQITQVKVRAARSWIREILFPTGDKAWGIMPTPMAELPAAIQQAIREQVSQRIQSLIQAKVYPTQGEMQEALERVEDRVRALAQKHAEKRAERMERYMEDITEEGGWRREMEDFIDDFTTYPYAVLKGPVTVMRQQLEWQDQPGGGVKAVPIKKPLRVFRRVSPFDLYPAPDATSVQDGPLIERMRLRRKDLYDLIGVDGYHEQGIRDAIRDYGESGYELALTHDTERDRLEGRDHDEWARDNKIDVLNYWGQIRGQMLIDWGLEEIPDPDDDYEANVMLVGEHVIRAVINPHPLGERPYDCASFESVNGQIAGRGLPEIIKDIQQMCNAAARSLANNMALASGPMMDISVDRLAEGQDLTEIHPWMKLQTTESRTGNSTRPAVQFYTPPSNADVLTNVYEFFSKMADEYSGIPPYAQGVNTSGGAAGTASGLSMLMGNAARGIKQAVSEIDTVVEGTIRRLFEHVMIHDDVPHIKGDLKVVARGSQALMNREQQAVRRTEMAQVLHNPQAMQLMGLEGYRQFMWDMLSGMDIDPEGILPDEEGLRQMMLQQQQQQQAMMQQQAQQQSQGPRQGRETDAAGNVAGGGDVPRVA